MTYTYRAEVLTHGSHVSLPSGKATQSRDSVTCPLCFFRTMERSKRIEVCLFKNLKRSKQRKRTRLIPEIGKIEKKPNWIEVKRTEAVFSKILWSPGIDSKKLTSPAYALAGRYNNPFPAGFLHCKKCRRTFRRTFKEFRPDVEKIQYH